MNYVVYAKQKAEGCDYSIACGECLYDLNSTNMEDALQEAEKMIKEDFPCDDRKLSYMTLYEINSFIEMDVDSIYKKIYVEKTKQEILEQHKKDEEEFERLKRKLNK
jgi:hypothetical protein